MSMQAREGQAEIRGGGRAWAVSVCGSSCCPGCSGGGKRRYENKGDAHTALPRVLPTPLHLTAAFSGPIRAALARKA